MNKNTPRSQTEKSCPKCHGHQYIIEPGITSIAKFCDRCSLACSLCDGTGFTLVSDEYGRDVATRCSCQELEIRLRMYNEAKVPGLYFDSTLQNFEITRKGKVISDILANVTHGISKYHERKKTKKNGFLFSGPVGTGKTRLVSSMIREYIFGLGIPCQFREFSRLLSEIKSGYDKGRSESELLEGISQVEILIIDELGKGRKSQWEINILDTIVSNRYNMGKVTIYTTNYTEESKTTYQESFPSKTGDPKGSKIVETLRERIHDRIYSRLKESCDFFDFSPIDDFRTLSQKNTHKGIEVDGIIM